jgi:GTP-binding protein
MVGSRADLAPAQPALAWDGERVSAVTGEGINQLVGRMVTLVETARAELAAPARYVVHRPEAAGIAVQRDLQGSWVVVGRAAERAVALSDLTNAEALAYAQGRLRGLGVDRALARAGARGGDRVRVGGFEFEYQPDDEVAG